MWGTLAFVLALPLLAVAFETARHFSGVAIDGPFQLYNALRRIDAGFTPGVGFQFFHGLGIPYLHYWFYRLFGGGLEGSELAREMLATMLYPLVFVAAFRVFTGKWTQAFALTAAALAISLALHISAVMFALNGMLGLRSTLPTLLPVALYRIERRRARAVIAGLVLGLALFMSTEQGMAALLAYGIVSALRVVQSRERRGRLIEAAAAVSLAVLCLILCLVAVGGLEGMRGALRYNFRVVPMDQYWFFGAPPNLFIPSWKSGARMLFALRPIGIAIVLAIVAAGFYCRRLWREPDGAAGRRAFTLALLALYGLVSCGSLLGIFTLAYSHPCWRVLIILGLVELTAYASRIDQRTPNNGWLGVPRLVTAGTLVCAGWALLTIQLVRAALLISVPHIITDHVIGREPFTVAGIWSETLRDGQHVIDSRRHADGTPPVLWSTYAGWLEARNAMFHPSVDYIIHALGPDDRAAYLARFRATRPELVQTVRPTYTQYEQWLENEDWDFYAALLDRYRPIAQTPWSIFWAPRANPTAQPRLVGAMNVPDGQFAVQLPSVPADSGGIPGVILLEVEIEYDVRNPLHALPIIGPTPRYLVTIDGAVSRTPVSLDPWVRRVRFPIVMRAGQRPTLSFQTFALLPGASWRPRSIQLWARPLDASTELWISDLLHYLDSSQGS